MGLNVHLCASNGEPLFDLTCYHHLARSLLYLDVTRPDISRFVTFQANFFLLPLRPTRVISSVFYDIIVCFIVFATFFLPQ
jgi:hypothetical protein